tara:strand:+ start:1663 stop:1845 length:183 start_codon:yes stop_codon:yes gene_type:complete
MDDIDVPNIPSIGKPVQYAEAKAYRPRNEKVNRNKWKPKKTSIPKGGGGRRFLSKGKYEK